jgi:hypothetical protein
MAHLWGRSQEDTIAKASIEIMDKLVAQLINVSERQKYECQAFAKANPR